jgi:hypothetical protein
MSFRKILLTSAVALSLVVSSSSAFAGDKGKGKALGQDIAPGQSASPGQGSAPGQTGTKPDHPDNFGATASNCADISDPKKKDDCVRGAKPN